MPDYTRLPIAESAAMRQAHAAGLDAAAALQVVGLQKREHVDKNADKNADVGEGGEMRLGQISQ